MAEYWSVVRLRKTRICVAIFLFWIYWRYAFHAVVFFSIAGEKHYVTQSEAGAWAEVTVPVPLLLTISYLAFVWAGLHFMERRVPRMVFEAMCVFNVAQVALNSQLAYFLVAEAVHMGFSPWGNTLDRGRSHRLSMLLYLQYHYRQLDLLDTVFIILRKKFLRITWLHILLKLLHMWAWFFAVRFSCGGDAYFPAAVNSACQAVVYSYYTLSMLDLQIPKQLQKGRIWEVQSCQYLVCALHALYVLVRGEMPRRVWLLNLLLMVTSGVWHVDFEEGRRFRRVQRTDTQTRSKTNDHVAPLKSVNNNNKQQQQQQPQQQLTFSFDSSAWLYCYHWGAAVWLEEHLHKDVGTGAYPSNLQFSGASGGALVAFSLASGGDPRAIFEHVLAESYPMFSRNPWRMGKAVKIALERFIPESKVCQIVSSLRVLLTRVSLRPPFITGEVVDEFHSREDCIDVLLATCHVPGVHIKPHSCRQGYYYDGLMWNSLFVPWQSEDDSHVVYISAFSLNQMADIQPPSLPLWWALFPPPVRILRGLFWIGYRDMDRWFAEEPQDECCGCFASRPRLSKQDLPARGIYADSFHQSRALKHRLARDLLVSQPQPLSEALLRKDSVTGDVVADLIQYCERSAARNMRVSYALILAGVCLIIAVFLYCLSN
ncbi:unnamed protein product [Polarella glacialis]|uniref:PNPLA domain-containing protein n=1 Tax=Polarella glacialis TaxID=89957 RepID=A0A813DGX4_POLGL|nr:unnamed protein product [Polarella glacialis]